MGHRVALRSGRSAGPGPDAVVRRLRDRGRLGPRGRTGRVERQAGSDERRVGRLTVKLTKYTHACVRLEKDGKVLLVDPGTFAEDEAFETADAILITHEHPDHMDADRLKSLDAPIYTNAGVA